MVVPVRWVRGGSWVRSRRGGHLRGSGGGESGRPRPCRPSRSLRAPPRGSRRRGPGSGAPSASALRPQGVDDQETTPGQSACARPWGSRFGDVTSGRIVPGVLARIARKRIPSGQARRARAGVDSDELTWNYARPVSGPCLPRTRPAPGRRSAGCSGSWVRRCPHRRARAGLRPGVGMFVRVGPAGGTGGRVRPCPGCRWESLRTGSRSVDRTAPHLLSAPHRGRRGPRARRLTREHVC